MKLFSATLSLVLRGLIIAYRYGLSPVLGAHCRYAPSCSAYAQEAIGRHGPFHGTWLAIKRIARCHPWGGAGYDPVPDATIGAHDQSASGHARLAKQPEG